MEYIAQQLSEMDAIAEKELRRIEESYVARSRDGAAIILLSGELGAGKTAFVKAMGRALSVAENIPSPTFVLARFYDIPKHNLFSRLVHVDAYRIEDEDELRPLGWDKIIADPKNLVFVEWPERIPESTEDPLSTLQFSVVNETTRRIHA